MAMIYEQPPALNGDAAAQLNQLYRYLFKLSEQLNASLETTDKQYARVLQTRSGSTSTSAVVTPQEDQQYRELRSLIIKTADIVNQNMDRVVTQLRSEYQAISEEWGEFEQNIERTIIDTAENTIEQFDYSELIEGIDKTVMGGITQYSIASLGYIKRGIIGFDEQNFPIYGIAVGTQLEGKTVIKDGKEYTVIDTTHNLATYTSDRISFWVNGVERAHFTADTLYVRRIKVIEGIDIGDDFSIELNDDSGLTVAEKLGTAIDISKNEALIRAEEKIILEVSKRPAKALETGTTVTITDEQFNVQTKQAAFSIIDDSSGEAEEKLRIDDDGLTSEEATFGTIHSDSVVLTQAATTFTPANAGELQAILDGLSNRFLLGGVTINAVNVSGGEFSLSGVHGNGMVVITGGTFNSLTLNNCRVMVRVQQAKFSTSGTAVSATASIVHVWNCTIDAGMGLNLNRYTDAILDGCTGTCTTLAGLSYSSVLRVSGSSVPYGVLGSVNGEVYSPLAFAAAPSAPSVETVTSASLAATSTRTWNGGWISGNVLYQGKVGSDGQLRRGCMWFDLSAIAGKTIVSATLTLKRVGGIGGGGSVSVGIYGTTAASASGTPAVGTKYASVSLANGATKSVDVTAAVQALVNGSIKGLMVYDTQTGTYNSKNYTYGYCKLYGSSDGAKPVLSVTYK